MRIGDSLVREVAARFEEIGERFELLAWIDREIIYKNLAIDAAVSEILKRSMLNLRAKAASAFVAIGIDVRPFSQPSEVIGVQTDPRLIAQMIDCTATHRHEARDKELTWLLLPISIDQIPSLKIIFVYESPWYGGETAPFYDPELYEFTKILREQCRIVISKRIEADLEGARKGIMDAFFGARLNAEQCWLELTKKFVDFLPNWPPLKIDPKPQVQFLTYDGNRETILLRAGTDQTEPTPAKALLIAETISGIVIEEESEGVVGRPLYVDPTDSRYKDRFRSYLLSNIPKSELVIPIRSVTSTGVDQTVALVNLEHSKDAVFSTCHIEILSAGAAFVTPFVAALLQEEKDQRTRDITHLYTMHNILTKMAKTYRHKVGQQITATTLSLEALEGVGEQLAGDERKFFERLQRSVSAFAELSRNFVTGLPNYVQFGPMRLLPLIETAIGEFDPEEMKRADDIEIKLVLDEDVAKDIYVFGSQLIAEQLHNILNNSVEAVRARIKRGDIKDGLIVTAVRIVQQTDKLKRQDSFPLVMIDIEDNGGGLSRESEASWGEARFTTKKGEGGTGFGIPSAIEYVTALGGKIEKKNGFPEKLNVLVYLPKYIREIHEPMSGRLNFGKPERKTENDQ